MNPFHIHLTIRGRINSGANIRSTAIPLSSTECSRGLQRISVPPPVDIRPTDYGPFDMYPLDFMERNLERIISVWLSAGYPLDGLKQTSPFCNLQQHMSRGNHYPTTPTAKTGERESYLEAYNIYI